MEEIQASNLAQAEEHEGGGGGMEQSDETREEVTTSTWFQKLADSEDESDPRWLSASNPIFDSIQTLIKIY